MSNDRQDTTHSSGVEASACTAAHARTHERLKQLERKVDALYAATIDLASDKKALRVLAMVAGITIGSIGGGIGFGISRIDDVEGRVTKAEAVDNTLIESAKGLRRDVDRNLHSIDSLEKE